MGGEIDAEVESFMEIEFLDYWPSLVTLGAFCFVLAALSTFFLSSVDEFVQINIPQIFDILRRLYQELMVCGFISVFVLVSKCTRFVEDISAQSIPLLVYDMISLLFVIAFAFYTLFVVYLMFLSLYCMREWTLLEQTDPGWDTEDCLINPPSCTTRSEGFHAIRGAFILRHGLSDRFSFASYLRKCTRTLAARMLKIHWSLWLALLALALVHRLRTALAGRLSPQDAVRLYALAATPALVAALAVWIKCRFIWAALRRDPSLSSSSSSSSSSIHTHQQVDTSQGHDQQPNSQGHGNPHTNLDHHQNTRRDLPRGQDVTRNQLQHQHRNHRTQAYPPHGLHPPRDGESSVAANSASMSLPADLEITPSPSPSTLASDNQIPDIDDLETPQSSLEPPHPDEIVAPLNRARPNPQRQPQRQQQKQPQRQQQRQPQTHPSPLLDHHPRGFFDSPSLSSTLSRSPLPTSIHTATSSGCRYVSVHEELSSRCPLCFVPNFCSPRPEQSNSNQQPQQDPSIADPYTKLFWFQSPRLLLWIIRLVVFYQIIHVSLYVLYYYPLAMDYDLVWIHVIILVPPLCVLFIILPNLLPLLTIVSHIGPYSIQNLVDLTLAQQKMFPADY